MGELLETTMNFYYFAETTLTLLYYNYHELPINFLGIQLLVLLFI